MSVNTKMTAIADAIREKTGSVNKLSLDAMATAINEIAVDIPPCLTNDKGWVVKYYGDISQYRNGVISTEDTTVLSTNHSLYPYLTLDDGYDYQNYKFRGWFSDEVCETGLESTVMGGSAYAKFVLLDEFACTSYISKGTSEESDKTNLTFVSPIFDLNINKTAIYYRYNNINATPSGNLNTSVFENHTLDGSANYVIESRRLHEKSSFMTSVRMVNIASKNYDKSFYVNKHELTFDGTMVKGHTNSTTCRECFNNIINVPLVINSTEEITEANVSLMFDTSIYEYVGYSDVEKFNSLEVDNTSFISNGILNIHGICTESKSIDETFIILKFKVLSEEIPSKNVFRIIEQSYLNGTEEVTMYIPNGIYQYAKPTNRLDTTDATATAYDILADKTAYVNGEKIEGTIPTKTASDLSVSGAKVSVPSGYYASNIEKSVSTVTQATPSVSINSSGLITASATQSAGYVSAGTKSGTKQLTTQAAKTITPSTSTQTAVAKNVYTTGAVTVAAIPSNYEDVATETAAYTTELSDLQTQISALETALEGKASGGSGGGSVETCTVTIDCSAVGGIRLAAVTVLNEDTGTIGVEYIGLDSGITSVTYENVVCNSHITIYPLSGYIEYVITGDVTLLTGYLVYIFSTPSEAGASASLRFYSNL